MLTVVGAVLFYTVQVELAFLPDDMGVSGLGAGRRTLGDGAPYALRP